MGDSAPQSVVSDTELPPLSGGMSRDAEKERSQSP